VGLTCCGVVSLGFTWWERGEGGKEVWSCAECFCGGLRGNIIASSFAVCSALQLTGELRDWFVPFLRFPAVASRIWDLEG